MHKLIIEALILLENAGFHASVVTMDGAQWNRGVWTLFGINEKKVSCKHPANNSKKLWFISDFPHLIKCLRNNLMSLLEFFVSKKKIIKSIAIIFFIYSAFQHIIISYSYTLDS